MVPSEDLKSSARKIFLQALAGIDIREAMERKLAFSGTRFACGGDEFDLANYSRIIVIAFGKASMPMAEAFLEILPSGCSASGIVVAPSPEVGSGGIPARTPRLPSALRLFFTGHPTPDDGSFAAARAILSLLASCDDKSIVFFLLSGGGSSLVELPLDPEISIEDVQALNKIFVGCGAPIDEINAVRKHLSAVKGGRLAAAAGRATKVTLGIMDVPERRESALASGPTLPDPTTVADVRRIADRYELVPKLPPFLCRKFEEETGLLETPKAGDEAFRNSYFEILLGMHDLFHHAHIAAECEGFFAICDNSTDDWPLDRAAEFLLAALAKLRMDFPNRCVAVIADGELSSPVLGIGVGGRNSAFVLECVERIAGQPIAVLSVGTDGIDGNSPAAGALADGETLAMARAANLDWKEFASRSDAYTYFNCLGDTIVTGRTGNNLRDLRLLLAAPLRSDSKRI